MNFFWFEYKAIDSNNQELKEEIKIVNNNKYQKVLQHEQS